MNNVVARRTRGHYRYHLFVRAKKTDAPFRWNFPPALFDGGHLAFHMAPNSDRMVVGENDAIHVAMGWSDARAVAGEAARRCGDVGDIYLVSEKPLRRVTVRVANGNGEAQAWHDTPELVMLGGLRFEAPAGKWTDISFDLTDEYRPGERLHVRLDVPGGIDLHSVMAE
jgi:hypothetical protein